MSSSEPSFCPRCGKPLQDRISKLYIDALSLLSRPKEPTPEALALHLGPKYLPGEGLARTAALRAFIEDLAPPQGKKTAARLIHPDAAVAGFFLIALLPLYNLREGDPDKFPLALGILALAVAAYALGRKKLLCRHRQKKEGEREAYERVRRGIETWLRLLRCPADGTVFDPADGRVFADAPLGGQLS